MLSQRSKGTLGGFNKFAGYFQLREGILLASRLSISVLAILFVDDDERVVALLREILEKGGHRNLVSSTDSRLARELFDERAPSSSFWICTCLSQGVLSCCNRCGKRPAEVFCPSLC
jgi:hypothetical protein